MGGRVNAGEMRLYELPVVYIFSGFITQFRYFQINILYSLELSLDRIYIGKSICGHVSGISGDGVVHLGPSEQTCRVR
jgi:hypothetical protein